MALCFVEEEEVCGENFPRFFCVLARIFPFCKIYDEDRENPILLLWRHEVGRKKSEMKRAKLKQPEKAFKVDKTSHRKDVTKF